MPAGLQLLPGWVRVVGCSSPCDTLHAQQLSLGPSQFRSLSSIFGRVQVVILSIFSTQLTSQASQETCRGTVTNVIAYCVVCSAFVSCPALYPAARFILALGWIPLRFSGD